MDGARGGLCSLLSLGSFVVGEEGGYGVGGEEVTAAQGAKFYEEGEAGHDAAGVLDEVAHGAGGAAGGEEVVDDEDAGAGRYGVGVDLQGVRTVLQIVGGGGGLPGELVGFAGEDEALFGPVGEGAAEDEAAGVGGEDAGVVQVFGGAGQSFDGGVEGGAVFYEGGYVLKGDAGLWEVGDLPDVA